jgi:DNA-binding protein Fis
MAKNKNISENLNHSLDNKTITDQLHDYISCCDGEELANMYQFAFAAVKKAEYDENNDEFNIEYEEGFGPNDVP